MAAAESALSPMRRGWRRLRHTASFQKLKDAVGPPPDATPLDWPCIIALQSLSMISILSTTYLFSTAVFMVREWGATDEAQAAAHAGTLIAAKPAFSALSSYYWGTLGDRVGFRRTTLVSAAVTAVLTAGVGAVSSFRAAVVLRALGGFFDGVMTLSKSAMAKISDRTNSARAFSTFGVNYGLGSAVGPAVSAVLAYPCGGDPNARDPTRPNPAFPFGCPSDDLRAGAYPFFMSSAWVLVVGAALWAYAFVRLRIPGEDGVDGDEEGDGGAEEERERAVEMTETNAAAEGTRNAERSPGASVALVREGGGVSDSGGRFEGKKADVDVELDRDPEGGDVDPEGGERVSLLAPRNDDDVEAGRGLERPSKVSANSANWRRDGDVRVAVFCQVFVAFVVITGAEVTPIWMATSRPLGGLGFTAVDIGAFGSVMGVTILVFAATLFAALAERFGATRAVAAGLFAMVFIYLAMPFAWVLGETTRAGAWAVMVVVALGRGCMGPVTMGGVSLILNNSAPRAQLGAVNGFANIFTNVARAAAPVVGGALVAGMVHATRTLVKPEEEGGGGGGGGEEPIHRGGAAEAFAEAVPPTWWPFALIAGCFLALAVFAARLPRRLDAPRE